MGMDNINKQKFWQTYNGPNLGYVEEQYERYEKDPESVEPEFRDLFKRWGAPSSITDVDSDEIHKSAPSMQMDHSLLDTAIAANKLVWNIRTYGHLAAKLDPLNLGLIPDTRLLEPELFHLSKDKLSALPASLIWENAPETVVTGWDAIHRLRQMYTKSTAYEFSQVHEEEEREWLNKRVEGEFESSQALSSHERAALLNRLTQVEQFEAFLHKTFVGQKRFSVEGTDALVPMLDEVVRYYARQDAKHILMGMAHRGRLNVLAHVLGKPYSKIFSEFHHSPNKDMVPSEGSIGINYGWTGDVKYHLGADRSVEKEDAGTIRLTLANNPSHLEFVNPVVEGFTRAAQDVRQEPGYPRQDESKAAAVLMHGDAAFAGEGIVAETLNFNRLKGFRNGGTIHIIVNNRLGFTTESEDSRSTHYASDLAKGFEIPIVHVNADDPEACIMAIRMACDYRSHFNKDFLIDLVGYRRYGHNESDDPETTQPVTYGKVRNHPTVRALYAKLLGEEGIISEKESEQMMEEAWEVLKQAYDVLNSEERRDTRGGSPKPVEGIQDAPSVDTSVPLLQLHEISMELVKWPEGFHVYPKLQRILEKRSGSLIEEDNVDWALAETLAFATLLKDGNPIRLTGQDSERGTFAHRHLVLHDAETGESFSPLHRLPQARASFGVYNSPLSEASVLGFEYGYSVLAPETLVIWEAQFGDFANAAQVVIDQFLAAGRGKWRQNSGLVMLLPHGYEGQGPEHSSARLERYLQLAGDNNWTVANLTRASQYFHLLRKQAALAVKGETGPLIIMSPKSLIRNPRVACPGTELSEGAFLPVLEQPGSNQSPNKVRRLILCSGKVAVDLEEAMEAEAQKDGDWMHMVRVEQLYPFPQAELKAIIGRFPNLEEIIWVQEEPRNMGAWSFMEPRIREIAPEQTVRYIGRPDRSSPASGYQNVHRIEQQGIFTKALEDNITETKEAEGIRL